MPDRIVKKGFSLSTFPPREKVLKHNLKNAKRDLSRVEKKIKATNNILDRPGTVKLTGPSPEAYLVILTEEKENLTDKIEEIEKELRELEIK